MSAPTWPFSHVDEVRFGDLDAQGHLNNVAFLTFVESARVAYAASVAGTQPRRFGFASPYTFLVVEVKISYRSPGHYGERIETFLRPTRVGSTSFHMDFEMRVGERLLADGYSVLVSYDTTERRPMRVPEPLRSRLIADGALER
jgi:acyl-CoA thioester hydrolase